MATTSSSYGHSEPFSPAASSLAGSSTLYSASTLSAADTLRDVFAKRIRSLTYLKSSLRGHSAWFATVQLQPADLAVVFDNERMHKRTLRYSLLGLSLSSILELGSPADLARAVVSLCAELEGLTDEQIGTMTSGAGAANFGAQRPKMRSFFKSGKQSLKRSTAAQAISEFGTFDSGIGTASTLTGNNEQTTYLMAPNIPFQLDFFQTFFTLCDMLTEVYYKMLSFLPKEAAESTGQSYTTFPRASSPPAEEDRSASISQTFSVDTEIAGSAVISSLTQELLLKADARLKKIINIQVKDIDVFARQAIKDELSSLDPLIKDLALDTTSTIPPQSHLAKASPTTTSGLPSNSSLPFAFTQPSSTPSTTPKKPSHFRRKPDPVRTSQDSHHGHHQFNLSSVPADEADPSLTNAKFGRLRNTDKAADVPIYPGSSGSSPTKDS